MPGSSFLPPPPSPIILASPLIITSMPLLPSIFPSSLSSHFHHRTAVSKLPGYEKEAKKKFFFSFVVFMFVFILGYAHLLTIGLPWSDLVYLLLLPLPSSCVNIHSFFLLCFFFSSQVFQNIFLFLIALLDATLRSLLPPLPPLFP